MSSKIVKVRDKARQTLMEASKSRYSRFISGCGGSEA